MTLDDLQNAFEDLHTQVIGRQIELYKSIDSTNSLLVQRARAGEPEGLVALADEQIAGKGRRGRSWASPPGSSILCSALVRPASLPAARAFALTLMAAVAAAQAIERAAGAAVELKWPNDLQMSGRKLGGVLVEIEGRGDMLAWAVIGCGININWDPGAIPELSERATSLQSELGRLVDRGAVARALIEELDRRYSELLHDGPEALMTEWRRRLTTIGKPISVEVAGRRLNGWALDVDEEGALLVRDDYGSVHRLFSGDVSVRTIQ